MNNPIIYDFSTMEDVAASIRKCVNVFIDIQEQMDSIIANLLEVIDGDAEIAFIEGHASVKAKYENFLQITQHFVDEFEKAIVHMIGTEEPPSLAEIIKSYF